MKLSHIHEDRTPSLADYLNEHPPLPLAGGNSIYDAIMTLLPGFTKNIRWSKMIKTAWYEQMEYELEHHENPLDNIKDEFAEEEAPIQVVIVVKGANEFEGQFAWHTENQDRHGREYLGRLAWSPDIPDGPPTPKGDALRWVEGKPPKIPWRYKLSMRDLGF